MLYLCFVYFVFVFLYLCVWHMGISFLISLKNWTWMWLSSVWITWLESSNGVKDKVKRPPSRSWLLLNRIFPITRFFQGKLSGQKPTVWREWKRTQVCLTHGGGWSHLCCGTPVTHRHAPETERWHISRKETGHTAETLSMGNYVLNTETKRIGGQKIYQSKTIVRFAVLLLTWNTLCSTCNIQCLNFMNHWCNSLSSTGPKMWLK